MMEETDLETRLQPKISPNRLNRLIRGNPIFQENLLRLAEIYKETRDISTAIVLFRNKYPKFRKARDYVNRLADQLITDLAIKGRYDELVQVDLDTYAETLDVAKLDMYNKQGSKGSSEAIKTVLTVVESRQKAVGMHKKEIVLNKEGDTNNNIQINNFGKLRKEDILNKLPPELQQAFRIVEDRKAIEASKIPVKQEAIEMEEMENIDAQ
jgi:hypothetical protein